MIKLLIGGSPCTFWSIAQKNNRETEPRGMGWELFKNYLIAKEKFAPDFFLYENNKSADEAIKREIRKQFCVWDCPLFCEDTGVRYIEINSALVSAQNRERFYVHNCGDVEQPEDRGILLRDILESGQGWTEKSYAVTTGDSEPVCLNSKIDGVQPSLQDRIYSPDGKSTAVTASYMPKIIEPVRVGDMGAKTGLYAIPVCYGAEAVEFDEDGKPTKARSYADGKIYTVYEVREGKITIKGKEYPIKLADGFYIIRKLTVKECCRLQTLPDDYCRAVSNSQAYKGLGNGWTAEVIIHILSHALKDIPRDEKKLVLSMYDGIGTGRYCLDKMGFTNVEYHAYEIDKYAMQIAMSNYPDIIQHGDAFAVREEGWKL